MSTLSITQRQTIYWLAIEVAESIGRGEQAEDVAGLLSLCPLLRQAEAKKLASALGVEDGEVLYVDNDGCIVQWSNEHSRVYNCGETPEEFGLHNLTAKEAARINVNPKREDV